MLHILLLILKIIGIILAVILGIIILLLGIILFVPIRYEVSAKCDGTLDSLKGRGKVTWLLHLLQAEVLIKGNKIKWQMRAAWVKKSNAVIVGGQKDDTVVKANEEASNKEEQEMEETLVDAEASEESAESSEKKQEDTDEAVKADRVEESLGCDSEKSKGKSIIEKIKDKIQNLSEKKEKITDLITEESHVRALKKIKKEVFILLKRLKPKKIKIKVKFGFEDPSVTGKVLGVIGMLYPILEDTTEIIPDFENQILKGTLYVKGRIRLCHFAVLAVKLLLCKDIRTSYKDIRDFKI